MKPSPLTSISPPNVQSSWLIRWLGWIRPLPVQLVLSIVLACVCHAYLPLIIKQICYTISLSLQELLMFMVPWIVLSSVYTALSRIAHYALVMVMMLLVSMMVSNALAVLMTGAVSYWAVFTQGDADTALTSVGSMSSLNPLVPLFRWSIDKPVSNGVALAVAFMAAFLPWPRFHHYASPCVAWIHRITHGFLHYLFIPLLPLFIFGFLMKLLHEQLFGQIMLLSPRAIGSMLGLLVGYMVLWYGIATYYTKRGWLEIGQNLLAPILAAFTTMSSAAALPFSLEAAEKNIGNKAMADAVMPTTVNIHTMGDAIIIPTLAMMMLQAFHLPAPSLWLYMTFTAAFTLTKFSGAGVPGGGILVMAPVLERMLEFSPEMIGMVTILYMLLDPIVTTGNVVGNNLFVIHFHALCQRFLKPLQEQDSPLPHMQEASQEDVTEVEEAAIP